MYNEEKEIRTRDYKVNAINTTRAEDVCHEAFLYDLLKGWNLKFITRFFNVAVAIVY